MRRRALHLGFVVFLLISGAGAACAQDTAEEGLNGAFVDPPILDPICGTFEDPLIRIRARLLFADGFNAEKVLVLYKSGKAAVVTLAATIAVDELAPQDRERVSNELARARVGFARNCTLDETVGLNGLRGTVQVTWYGRGERRNAFTVTTAETQTCSNAMQQLLFDLLLSLRVHGTT